MNKTKNIHEAIELILASLEKQGQAPGTLKNYKNSFNVFENYLIKHSIFEVDEKICLEYIYLKTNIKLHSFNGKILNSKINRRMKHLHLLLMYLDTGEFCYEPRKIKEAFRCAEGFRDEYEMFMDECKRRRYANSTFNSNIQKVQFFLEYLDSIQINSSDEITLNHVSKFLALYDNAAVKYIGTILYVLRNYLTFIYQNGFTCCDFSPLLPKVRVMRNSSIPYVWKKRDILKLLNAIDREDPKGKRDLKN